MTVDICVNSAQCHSGGGRACAWQANNGLIDEMNFSLKGPTTTRGACCPRGAPLAGSEQGTGVGIGPCWGHDTSMSLWEPAVG